MLNKNLGAPPVRHSATPASLRGCLLVLAVWACLPLSAQATSFTVAEGETEATRQVLTADGETGTIEEGGALDTTASEKTSIFVNSGGDNAVITNRGTISTAGDGNASIYVDQADNVRIDNIGAITTAGSNDVDGVYAQDNPGMVFTNSGMIITSAGISEGIATYNTDNVEITNTDSGTITVTGEGSDGIFVEVSMGAVVTNNGMIRTEGSQGSGIGMSGNDGEIIIANSGAITTIGAGSEGISVGADNAVVTNSGAITTTGADDSDGISMGGNNVAVTNSGTITTMGKTARGILVGGSLATINHSGTITTAGETAHGIETGADSTVTVSGSGTITTTGETAHGIETGADSTVTVSGSGTITVTGEGSDGIFVEVSMGAVVTNNGMIRTEGSQGSGIGMSGNDGEIIIANSGAITTIGAGSEGISVGADNAVVTNSGAITTTGADDSDGISMGGNNVAVTNSGTITTMGKTARGILVGGSLATINHSGTITTAGETAHGIETGADSTVTVSGSGTITTTGETAHGIETGADSTVTVSGSGTITTTGETARGILVGGSLATINHSGTITTAGETAHGIETGADSTVTVSGSGTITTTGETAHGIETGADSTVTVSGSGTITTAGKTAHGILTGADSTVTVSGMVSVTGGDAYAIQGRSGQELNLETGAQIHGRFNLGAGSAVNIQPGVRFANLDGSFSMMSGTLRGPSTTLSFGDDVTINRFGGGVCMQSGGTMACPDPTGQSANRIALDMATQQIHRTVRRQLAQAPGIAKSGANAWGRFFGGDGKRGDDGAALAWDNRSYGVVGGYETMVRSGQRAGLFAGFSRRRIETEIKSIENDTDSVFVGVYGQRGMGGWSLNGALIAGYEDHEDIRIVQDNEKGVEHARADYSGFYISPSVGLMRIHKLAGTGVELRPSGRATFTWSDYDSYDESGTTNSNLHFGGRKEYIFDARAQLGAAYAFAGKRGEIEVRAGGKYSNYDGERVTASLISGGAPVTYRVAGEDNIFGGYGGVGIQYAIKDRFNLVVDVEYERAAGSEESISGALGLEIKL